jgi:hypothetical protein
VFDDVAALEIVSENCSSCDDGRPLASGAYGPERARVRWMIWTCGHLWTSDAREQGDRAVPPSWLQRLIFTGRVKRHAPLLRRAGLRS